LNYILSTNVERSNWHNKISDLFFFIQDLDEHLTIRTALNEKQSNTLGINLFPPLSSYNIKDETWPVAINVWQFANQYLLASEYKSRDVDTNLLKSCAYSLLIANVDKKDRKNIWSKMGEKVFNITLTYSPLIFLLITDRPLYAAIYLLYLVFLSINKNKIIHNDFAEYEELEQCLYTIESSNESIEVAYQAYSRIYNNSDSFIHDSLISRTIEKLFTRLIHGYK